MSKNKKEKQRLINELTQELKENNLAIFAGAGLSIPAGYVNWSQLLKPIAEDLDLDIDKETDLIALAQYHCNKNLSNRGKINQLLINEFAGNFTPTTNHQILASLPIFTYWTTNYDKLIENSLVAAGKNPDVKYTNKQLIYTKRNRDSIVYKMHGDVDHPDQAVIIKDDYESYHLKMQPFLNALSGDLISKTFLFLGFSFTDPNLDYILSRVRISYTTDQRQHYCIQKRIEPLANESKAETEYRERKQKLFTQDLLRFGIKTFLVERYSEITDILKEIKQIINRQTIFISGAAHEYGAFDREDAENFIHSLSKNISKEGFKIVSGFGLGVGSCVITGVLEQVYMNGGSLDNDQLILRPFPQAETGVRTLSEVWNDYRHDMISHAGIAIFMFGNKLIDGQIIESDGLIKEYEIAKSKGLFLIPIGVTGYAAKSIFNKLSMNGYFSSSTISEKIKKMLTLLNDSKLSLKQINDIVIDIIKLLNEER